MSPFSLNYHSPFSPGHALRFTHFAMATEYEIYVSGADPVYAAQASQAAFAELDRLENEFSRFLPNSDISRINHLHPGQRIVIGPDTMACLETCFSLFLQTKGAFDVSMGALYKCWLNEDKTLRWPSFKEIAAAGQLTGMHHLFFDKDKMTVAVDISGLQLDLGAFGKGYAVDRMVLVLKEWDIPAALIHGGSSSAYAFGGEEGWLVTISHPQDHSKILCSFCLQEMALSGSGVQKGFHIIDPRQGQPIQNRPAAWVIAPDAATSDALSTAFMVMPEGEIREFCAQHPELAAALLLSETDTTLTCLNFSLPE